MAPAELLLLISTKGTTKATPQLPLACCWTETRSNLTFIPSPAQPWPCHSCRVARLRHAPSWPLSHRHGPTLVRSGPRAAQPPPWLPRNEEGMGEGARAGRRAPRTHVIIREVIITYILVVVSGEELTWCITYSLVYLTLCLHRFLSILEWRGKPLAPLFLFPWLSSPPSWFFPSILPHY